MLKAVGVGVSLAVHSLPGAEFDPGTADQQVFRDSTTDTYGPGAHTVSVPLP